MTQTPKRNWEYIATQPMLPPQEERRPNAGPRMDYDDMAHWLNTMDGHGWEFVCEASKEWRSLEGKDTQRWWIFRRPFVDAGRVRPAELEEIAPEVAAERKRCAWIVRQLGDDVDTDYSRIVIKHIAEAIERGDA